MKSNAFRKELDALARKAQAAGWRFDTVLKVWRHAGHARHYTSLTMLDERILTPEKETKL